jgi:cell division protein FtsL
VAAVVQTDPQQRKGLGVGAFLLALVTAGAMAHVGVRMKGLEVAYDLGREKQINTKLEEERRRLNIEIGMLKDPGRVVSFARDKLKMGPPAQADVVRLAPGQVLGAHEAEVAAAEAAKQAEKIAKAARRAAAREEKAKRVASAKDSASAGVKDSASAGAKDSASAGAKDSASAGAKDSASVPGAKTSASARGAENEDVEGPRSTGEGDE